jgi:glutamate-1-semialdehyde 2,1-aminomutase
MMARTLTRSHELQQRAEKFFPGGVNSPVRAFGAVGGEPPFLARAEGAYLWDADGNRYIDYFGSWGPMILGHAFPPVVEAIQQAAARSASFGASTEAEGDLAELVAAAFPSMQKMRFVSSGTEATMSAIRVARAFTGRKYIIKFEGCYHGHADGLLVKAGSGVATFGIPGSAGVLDEAAHFTLALPYNDVAAVEAAFAEHEIACVIVEPVVGNAGCIPPAPGYLESLRSITKQHDALLIFDEVMTGFRVAFGGAQEFYLIHPDLTTLGKILGGGLPCGAFGGRAEIMDQLAPLGPVYQAGTLSGNPLAMAAGIAMLSYLKENRKPVYASLERMSADLANGVALAADGAGVSVTTNRVGAMFTWFFNSGAVTDFASAARSDLKRFAAFHHAMLEAGVWLPPSQYEAAFLSFAHADEDIRQTVETARKVLASIELHS